MDNLRNCLAIKIRKVAKLELENKLTEAELREVIDNLSVKEAELVSIKSRINDDLATRGNAITDALDIYMQRVREAKKNVASISTQIAFYRDCAMSTIEDSIDLYEEIYQKENDLSQAIGHILEVQPPTYEPEEDWLKDENEFKKKAKEMIESDKKFMDQRRMATRKIINDLSRVSLPRAEAMSSQSTICDSDETLINLHNLIPED